MKNILGLDLGTTSIGWAFVKEDENHVNSQIIDVGVRVNPLTTDEQTNFEKGKPITTNAGRTLARSARRNLQRYKLRREHLIKILKENQWISDETILAENGNRTTFETLRLRSLAATSPLELGELARVFLMINKKRGYKSSRKTNKTEEGQLIDGMDIAKKLYHDNLTPGQYVLALLESKKKKVPDFYRSDLQAEFDRIWIFQKGFYPDLLIHSLKDEITGKGKVATWAILKGPWQLVGIKRNKKRDELKIENYHWRDKALTEQVSLEELAIVLQEINGQLTSSSGYLGAISDRSKELYFTNQTVGQYLYNQVQKNSHTRLKSQVFYRQDYMDEFETIWSVQAIGRESILTDELKKELRDIVIFYQRSLKSQKGLISFCEFEQKEIVKEGKKIITGSRVAPRSSLLFQEFKIWQNLHNVKLKNKTTKEVFNLTVEEKQLLFEELNLKGNLSASDILELLVVKPKEWELNYSKLEGNRTNELLYNTFLTILENEGYDVREELKLKLNKDEITLADLKKPAHEIKNMVRTIFEHLHLNTAILDFNAELEGQAFELQPAFQLWHLLYSYEEDSSSTGMERMYRLMHEKFGFSLDQAKVLGVVALQDDYGSLSTKALRTIYPFLKEHEYSEACNLAGYRHSKHSLTKEEIENRTLQPKLEVLTKNSLRNPVVEKILNQMINVVNALIDTENDKREKVGLPRCFQFDEIRIELARELKKNAKEREELTKAVNTAKIEHDKIVKILQTEDNIKFPTRNDIIRYKLYQELKNNSYKDLYSNTYIKRADVFTKAYDIEHILPQSRLFDDSFSNKTLVPREINLKKGKRTAIDFIADEYGEAGVISFEERIAMLFNNKDEGISKAKYKKLLMKGSEIGEGFIERDLRDSQYIAKKAKELLFQITRSVVSTSGSVTDRLRQDWGLVNVMKELNMPKYRAVGLTEQQETKDGNLKEVITDWTKRNDHRHHAMDALTVAFTKHNHIQYLNNLNARKNEAAEKKANIYGIEAKETYTVKDQNGNTKRLFKEPMPHFRSVVKQHLESILISHKAKNKVVTKNKNTIKQNGDKTIQNTLTPRGQLHKETVYGKYHTLATEEIKVDGRLTPERATLIANKTYRNALLARLASCNNDPKKAFTGKNALEKSPIFLDGENKLPERVKIQWYEPDYSIRKAVGPDLKIDKVIDPKIREILQQRLDLFKGDAKKAFSDLEQNPIWLNEAKGISIKRVKISGVKNAEALHHKRDHQGHEILDTSGKPIPSDFVSTGNNHHVAIYEDEKGNLQDRVVSFYEAVACVNAGVPVIDKHYNASLGWKFKFTMKQNEMFVFPSADFNPHEIDLLDPANRALISKHLFRVQKIATKNYFFRHHLETNVEEIKELVGLAFVNVRSTNPLGNLCKVRINHLGHIVAVGEE